MERNYMANGSKDHGIICRRSTKQNSGMLKDYSWSQISQTRVGFGEGDLHQDQNSNSGPGGGVFSWPPRSYSCSFCKREFRSAQALGGHMNVHRRDRARLRQSSPLMDNNNNNVGQFTTASHPPLNLNLCPNHFSPNPSYNNNHDDGGEDDVVSPPTNCTGFSSVVSASSPGPALSSSSSKRFAYLGEDKINQVGNVVEGALLIDPLSSRGADFVKKGARKSFFGTEKSAAGIKPRDGCKFLKNGAMVRLDLEIGVLGDHTKEELDLELRLGCS